MNSAAAAPMALDDFNPNEYSHDVRQREAVRYLFFPGDVISPQRKEEREDLRAGGDEIGSRCLVRTKQYLRKCRITPLERWVELMPRELMPEGVTPVGMTPTSDAKGSAQGMTSYSANLYGYPKYPGEEIGWITNASRADGRKGQVELTELFDVEWDDFDRSGIQKVFFPDFPYIPATLREVEELIRAHSPRVVQVGFKRVDTGRIQSQMIVACNQFRRWGTSRIEAENLLLRIGTHKDGWTYTYSSLADVLLPQLEMARADDYMHDQAKFQKKLGENQDALTQALLQNQKGGDTEELVLKMQRQFQEHMQSVMQQNQEFLTTLVTGLINHEEEDDQDEGEDPPSEDPRADMRPKSGRTPKNPPQR